MAATNREIDFTVLESFHLLFKNLWSMNIAYRVKMNIVDTILFKDGTPVLWIFTSEQTGEIMKKKDERLESIPEIVRTLKLKSRSFTGSKDSTMRNKIATVWSMESERKVNSYIVDENELKSILSNSLTEILCVQTYTGGMCFRGNGIFEHRVWTQRDGAVKHITYENINMERGCVDRFTCESEKMAITEHQHGSMCSMSNQLITHMGFMNKCKVGGLIIQVVFTEGWVPHLIAAKKITFSNVPQHMVDMREEVAYPTGKAPRAPVFSAGSLLLPASNPKWLMRKTSTLGDAPAPVGAPQQGASVPTSLAETQPEQQSSLPQGSMKVRSSSLSYLQSGSTKYTNFNVEQERKEAVAQRQMSASSEKYISEAMQEVKAIAAAVEDTVFGSQADAGSSKVPFSKRGSSKFQPGGSSKGSSKARHFSQSSKLPAVSGVVDVAGVDTKTSTPEQSEVARETAVRPAVHRGSLSSSAKFTKPQPSINQGISDSHTGTAGLVVERFEKPLLRRAFTTNNLDKSPPEEVVSSQRPPLAPSTAPQPCRGTDSPIDEEHSELQIPYIDPTKEPSRINYGAEDYFATVHLSNKPSTIHLLQAARDGANRPAQAAPAVQAESKRPKPSQKMAQTAPNVTIPTTNTYETQMAGPGSPKRRTQTLSDTAAAEYPATVKTAPIHRLFRPDSASSVTKLRQTMEKVKVAEGASTGLLNATATGRRNQTTTSAAGDVQKNFQLRAFEINTEVRSAQTAFYKSQLDDHDAALKEQAKVFERRRPISAPHTTRPKHKVPPELLPPGDIDREYDESGKPNLQRYHPKGFSLAKPLPLSGTLCFGTYCNFSKRAKNAAVNENKEGAPPKLERCSECPHQVTYKSILLAKSEARFLGADIDENIESLIDQIRLTSVSTEQLYTYLVRRHLNRVAEKCQEEGRKMQVDSTQAHSAQEQQADLNLVYRRLVYADALAHIHPSRFYYTVPLCEMCYKVYTFMDAQRETAILHNIDVHQQTLAAAAASAEKAKFTITARTVHVDGTRRQTVMPGKMIRMPVEAKHKSGQLADHHAAGHEGEDPYESDVLLDTDEFIPHHSAQRDIYNDQHKRDNFATTLRNNVATLQAASAEKARRLNRSPDTSSRSPSPPNSSSKVPSEMHSPDAIEGHAAITPPHSARRKVVLPRDRVPINHHDNGRFNDTSDSGIGSRGREHPHQVSNVTRTAGTISSWVKLLRSSAEGAPANAQYDRTFGWRTNQEWDNQGNPKHLRPTSSSAIRLQSNRHLPSAQRPQTAQAIHRQPSDGSSGFDSGPSAHVQFASGSQLQGSDSGALPPPQLTLNPHPGSSSKRRPSSAGAVPYPSSRKGHSKRAAARREEAVASLELNLANKMLELSDHLAESKHPEAANNYHQQDFAQPDDGFEDAYAYSSLPFMAAPYLPAFKANAECVADAAYTQLQIDPSSHRVIPPQPTPEQQRQLQLELEQREIRYQLKAKKQRLRQEEEVQQRQLQEERDEIALRQRRRSSNLKPSPSTEFIPVSSHAHQHQDSGHSTPLWQQGGIAEDDAAFEVALEENEKLYGTHALHQEPLSEVEIFHQQQYLLQLQQQKEFRQLQHQQQLMHQKHQQQMLQQQIQFHERRRQEDEEVQHVLSDSQVLQELDILSTTYNEVPVRKSMDLRDSVEMSPMSPPVFEFFQDASVTETDAFPAGAEAVSNRPHQHESSSGRNYADDGDDDMYESDEDFVRVDSGKSDYDQATERVASTESARRDESALVIDTTRKGSSVRFAGADSFISPVEVDVEGDRGGHLHTPAREQKSGVADATFGDTPESASAKAQHRNIRQFASQSSDSPDVDGQPGDAGSGRALTLDVSANEHSASLSPCPEFSVPFPLARSPLATKQSRAAESFPSPDGESRRQSVDQILQ